MTHHELKIMRVGVITALIVGSLIAIILISVAPHDNSSTKQETTSDAVRACQRLDARLYPDCIRSYMTHAGRVRPSVVANVPSKAK